MSLHLVQNHGLRLVKKPARSAGAGVVVLREGTTGRVVAMTPRVLPRVWAVGTAEVAVEPAARVTPKKRRVELAFYRKYTEAMLRRYLRLSMSAGRVPSLIGRELFRGSVSSYQKVHSFEDVVIFCHDVERCLARLDPMEKMLLRRVTLQEYSQEETASLERMSLRTVARRYAETVDKLTGMFLETRLLDPQKSCQ